MDEAAGRRVSVRSEVKPSLRRSETLSHTPDRHTDRHTERQTAGGDTTVRPQTHTDTHMQVAGWQCATSTRSPFQCIKAGGGRWGCGGGGA